IEPRTRRLLAGQRVLLKGQAFSAVGDVRNDAIEWSSTAPAIAEIGEGGMLTARAPGRATVVARVGEARATLAVEVVANTIAGMEVQPARVRARTGDVVRFDV